MAHAPPHAPPASLSVPYLQHLATTPYHPAVLVDFFSDLEAEAIQANASEIISMYYTCYLLGLILDDDLPEARMLTKRIQTAFPDFLNNDPGLISAYTVLRSIWSRDYAVFYQTVRNAPWNEVASVIVGRVLDSRRSKTTKLLALAYTSIPPSKAAVYLGADNEQDVVEELVSKHGWGYDEQQKVLLPVAKDEEEVKTSNGRGKIGKLASLVGHLSDL